MRLTLNALQRVTKQIVDDERAIAALREEIARVLGPAVIVEGKIEEVAAAANDQLEVLNRTGRAGRLNFKTSVLVKFIDHKNAELRKLAARALPERFVHRFSNDRSPTVRLAAARRLPLPEVKAMMRRFSSDDELRVIYNARRLSEAGIKQPKVNDEYFDINGKQRLGDAVKQDPGVELSDLWYRSRAEQFLTLYGQSVEFNWEETLAHRYVANVKASTGIELDEKKLLKAIKDLIDEQEDRVMERNALKEVVLNLRLSESVMPALGEDVDPVRELVESGLSSETYVNSANVLFSIQEGTLPMGIRKYNLGESNSHEERVPVVGRLPHSGGFRSIDERALDAYCKAWNSRQRLRGEPLQLEWSVHPDAIGKISFNVSLR